MTAEAQLDDPYVLIGSVAFVLIFRGGQQVRGTEPGSGRWYRPLTWFNDATQREDNAVLIPFSTSTLERGLKAFEADGLIEVRKLRRNPRTNKPFKSGPRNLYINKFGTLTEAARIVPAEQFDAELQQLVTQQSQQR